MTDGTAARPLLSAEAVTVKFGGLVALHEVNLQVVPGSITGLIGPNGAGKTTMFNVISGLTRPAHGRVLLDDQDITGWAVHRRARAGIARTYQRLELFVGLTVRDNLLGAWEASFAGGVLGRNSDQGLEVVQEVLELLGLTALANRRAGELPTGLGRLVELGRALCTRPRVLLLDEPSSGLDAAETARFRDLLVETVQVGAGETAVLLVEHDMRLVMEVCQRITVLDFGRRICCGDPEEVRGNPSVQAAYLGEGDMAELDHDDGMAGDEADTAKTTKQVVSSRGRRR